MSFAGFLGAVQNVTYGFEELLALIGVFFTDMLLNEHVASALAFMNPIWQFMPYITLGVSVLLAFFGKKMFGLFRFLFFFTVGALTGIYMLAPIILGVMPSLPTWVIGVVTGVVAGVLSKIVYFLALAAAAGYSTYIVLYTGLIPGISALTEGNWVIGAIVSVVVVILVFALLKFVEMLGTAVLGGYGVATVVLLNWWNYTELSIFASNPALGVLVFTGVVALLGLIVQIKTRKRYV